MNTNKLLAQIASLGPCGRLPHAPGTWGSLFAAVIAPFCFLPLSIPLRALLLLIIFIAGAIISGRAEAANKQKDPGWIVIDELLGQWTAFLYITSWSWTVLAAGFVFFRIFDILKPFPVKRAEKWLPGGWSIMLDDLLAGIYAMAALQLLVSILSR
ncbi:MAG: phosphatidylglycerophosphatase A family protein [Thermodesulfobacteriota bacterium]